MYYAAGARGILCVGRIPPLQPWCQSCISLRAFLAKIGVNPGQFLQNALVMNRAVFLHKLAAWNQAGARSSSRRRTGKAMQPSTTKPFSYEVLPHSGLVAYFSMEIAIHPSMPTYSGGLGV